MAHWKRWLPYLLVVGSALAVYAPLPGNPLLHDAPIAIERNAAVQSGPLLDLFRVDFWGAPPDAAFASGSYRPLVSLTFAVETRLFPGSTRIHHVDDMLLHGLGAALLLMLLMRYGPGVAQAGPAALFYAVHPLISDAVCSVVGRADLMAAALLFGALICRHGSARNGLMSDTLALACLAAALLTKEYAVTFPFILALADLLDGRDPRTERSTLGFWIAAVALLLGYLGLRLALIGSLGGVGMLTAADHPLFDASLATRWAMALRVGLLALRLLVWPWPLNHFYRYGTLEVVDGPTDPAALLGSAVLIGLTAAFAWAAIRHRVRLPLLGWALIVLPLAPSLNTVALAGVVFAERFMVLPVAGAAMVLGWTLSALRARKPAWATAGTAVVVVGCLGLAGVTWTRIGDWTDAERLARSSLRAYPGGAEVWEELGVTLAAQGRQEEAAEAFGRSVALRDHAPRTWMNYAVTLGRLGRHAEAAEAWRRTVALSPPSIGLLWRGLGDAEAAAGNLDAAVDALTRAAELQPDDPSTAAALDRARRAQDDRLRRTYRQAIAADGAGDRETAIGLYRQILESRPEHPPTLFNLGRALFTVGRPEEALEPLRRGLALQEDPRARALLRQIESGH